MALWYLNRPREKCDLGELQVAEFLAALPDEWIVRWGFHYHDDQGTVREGDFLVLGPNGGLMVLEAKRGTLDFNPHTGRWDTADGDNPQVQLDAEWKGVLWETKESQGARPSLFVGRALALPELSLGAKTQSHHGIPRQFILDRADLQDFASSWNKRMSDWGAFLDGRSRDIFFDTFGSAITPKAIRHFVDETDRALLRQTEASYELLDNLKDNQQFLVQGGAGSGKTWMAFELACRWANTGARVLFLCYNHALTALIREMAERAKARKQVKRGEIVVRAWEELASGLVSATGMDYDVPQETTARTRFYECDLPQLLVQIVSEGHCRPEFDALVADEGQDHDTAIPGFPEDWAGPGWWGVYWELLKEKTNSRLAVFLDPAQRPAFRSGGGFSVPTLLGTPGYRPVQVRLTRTVRYTLPVFEYLKSLPSQALQQLAGGLVQRGSLPDGPEVAEHTVEAAQVPALADRIISDWLERGWCRPEQVLVLSRRSRKVDSALRECVQLAGCSLVDHLGRRPGEIGMLSVNRAKGLDALAVLLVDYAPWDTLSDDDRIGWFMGASRARQLLAIIQSR